MARYTTVEDITIEKEVSLDININVQDQDGNDIECDIDGDGLTLTAQINTRTIREELREEVLDECLNQAKETLIREMALSKNPIRTLSGMLSITADQYEEIMVAEAEEIRILKHELCESEMKNEDLNNRIRNFYERDIKETERRVQEREDAITMAEARHIEEKEGIATGDITLQKNWGSNAHKGGTDST